MPKVTALAGGVGGSKLALGLYAHLAEELTVIVNTGDDETMYGLRVCPDLDTMRYTLSGMANADTGWGLTGDTFYAIEQLRQYGLDPWFQIGDRDLATDMARTELLRSGRRLTQVEAHLGDHSGLKAKLLPMCDEPVATRVMTPGGELDFQEYFVKRHHQDTVTGISYRGIEQATLNDEVSAALSAAELVVLCPSNPGVSITPILAVPGLRPLLRQLTVQRIAVSPIVGGAAVSGPAGHMMAALGFEVSVLGLAAMYQDFLTGLVIDERDAELEAALQQRGLRVLVTSTIMKTADDKRRLAGELLAWAGDA